MIFFFFFMLGEIYLLREGGNMSVGHDNDDDNDDENYKFNIF